jgi:FkbM family methyltransferase
MNKRLKGAIRKILPQSLSPHKIIGGPLRGSAIVTSWHDYPAAILGRTEGALLDYFAKNVLSGETWLDVGAHYGYTAIALCKLVGASGRVFAFEPMLNTAGCIARTRFLNDLTQLTVVPMGLGNGPEIFVDSLYSVRGMIDSTLNEAGGFKETFLVSRLDWLWPQISGTDSHVDGIKIDVQGMEIQVLEGMAPILKKYRPKLFLEIHRGVPRPQLLALLGSLGYSPRGIAVEPLPEETDPLYADDRTYFFTAIPAQVAGI